MAGTSFVSWYFLLDVKDDIHVPNSPSFQFRLTFNSLVAHVLTHWDRVLCLSKSIRVTTAIHDNEGSWRPENFTQL